MSDKCRELHAQLVEARRRVDVLEIRLRREVRKFLPEKDDELTFLLDDLRIGDFWDCPKSPTGHCVYDRYKDPVMDDCLFCHEPAERK